MRKLLFTIIIISCSTTVFCQTQTEKFDVAKCKMKLTEYLLSCHAVIMSALAEDDVTQKYYLGNKALEYYNYAAKQFSLLKQNTKLDETLKNDLDKTLQAYSEIVGDKSKLFKPEISFALQIMDSKYKLKILPKLWCDK